MRLDYSEKKGPRESTERKPVQKNRPRKESSLPFAFLSLVVLLLIFGAGVLTGWLAYKGTHKVPAIAAVTPVKKDEPVPLPIQATAPSAETPALTFYKTLPAGGKGVIGSGLNPKKPEPVPGAQRRVPAAPPAPAAQPSSPAAPQPATPSAAVPPQEEQEANSRFVVQLASYREKQEAERTQARLSGKGIAAYLLESKRDNGVWYRIRVGKHLTKTEAEELAAKAGKGAVVLPE